MNGNETKVERLQKLREGLKEHPEFEPLIKIWTSASRMRLWITEKKKNLAIKLEKEVTKEFKEEKAAALKKQKKDEPKEDKKETSENTETAEKKESEKVENKQDESKKD